MTAFPFTRKLYPLTHKEITMRFLIFLSILFTAGLQAGSIHKWVDSEGNTHYGDAPPAATSSQQVRVLSAPSDPGKALPRLANDDETEATSEVPADQAAIACQQAREDLEVINNSSRIQLKSPDGSLRYLSTEEIATRKEKSEADIEEFC